MTDLLEEDSPIINTMGKIQDNSFPRINEGWIKKDDIRFDEPKPKDTEEIPYGSMDLGVDPNRTIKVQPGEALIDKKPNKEVPEEETDHFKTKTKTVLRFSDTVGKNAEYRDPRIPKVTPRILKLKDRTKDDL